MPKRIYIKPGLNSAEAARILGISQAALRNHAKAGRVGTAIIGKRTVYRYSREDLERFRAIWRPRK